MPTTLTMEKAVEIRRAYVRRGHPNQCELAVQYGVDQRTISQIIRAKTWRKRRSLRERFWEKVDKQGPDDCWRWLGAVSGGRYGQIHDKGRARQAHRVAWELVNGPIPEGMYVCHHCDDAGCVNPAHLFLGTQRDNMRDMWKKNRARPGGRDIVEGGDG